MRCASCRVCIPQRIAGLTSAAAQDLEALQKRNAELTAQLAAVRLRRAAQASQDEAEIIEGLRQLRAATEAAAAGAADDKAVMLRRVEELGAQAESELRAAQLRQAADLLTRLPGLALETREQGAEGLQQSSRRPDDV